MIKRVLIIILSFRLAMASAQDCSLVKYHTEPCTGKYNAESEFLDWSIRKLNGKYLPIKRVGGDYTVFMPDSVVTWIFISINRKDSVDIKAGSIFWMDLSDGTTLNFAMPSDVACSYSPYSGYYNSLMFVISDFELCELKQYPVKSIRYDGNSYVITKKSARILKTIINCITTKG